MGSLLGKVVFLKLPLHHQTNSHLLRDLVRFVTCAVTSIFGNVGDLGLRVSFQEDLRMIIDKDVDLVSP